MSGWAIGTTLDAVAVDLPASTETDLLGANGVDCANVDFLIIEVLNDSGSYPIDVLTVYEKAPGSSQFDKANVSFSSVAASKGTTIRLDELSHGFVRLTATSANPVSADVHVRGIRKDY